MPTLKQLEAFYWSQKLGSFVEAAQRLNTTQSNISKRIQDLEQSLGSILFDRSRRRISLSLPGRQLLPMIEELLSAQAKIASFSSRTAVVGGRFILGCSETVAMSWLPKFIAIARSKYPNLIVEPRIDDISSHYERLNTNDIDLVLGSAIAHPYDFTEVPLASEQLVWVCHPQLRPAASILNLEDLARLPLIVHAWTSGSSSSVAKMFRDAQIKPNVVASCSSIMALVRLVVDGLGITHLPKYVVAREIDTGRLCVLNSDPPLSQVRYAAVYRHDELSMLPADLAGLASIACDFTLY